MILLSILVPSLSCREHLLDRMLTTLSPQLTNETELRIDLDDGQLTIGEKRNRLLKAAQGHWTAFVDDDDCLSPSYVQQITDVIKRDEPDAIGFKMRQFISGVYAGYRVLSSTAANKDKNQVPTSIDLNTGEMLRDNSLMHLNPIRRQIAQRYEFPPTNLAEDVMWARQVRQDVKKETYIDDFLYDYYYVPRKQRNEVSNVEVQKNILRSLGIIGQNDEIRV